MNTRANHSTLGDARTRPLSKDDLERVVAIDREITGRSRRGYFEKRLASALRWPKRHLQTAAVGPGGVVGFLLARVSEGEYGREDASCVIEAVGVASDARRAGIGGKLVAELESLLRTRSIGAMVTEVDWHNHSMARLLDAAGFSLAPRVVLERPVHRMPLPSSDEEIERVPPVVRVLEARDFDMVARIDHKLTGRSRVDYLVGKFDEVRSESAIEVSLVVESDSFLVGFAMARVDSGDFGHVETTASLDTLGIHPSFARQGFARALLTQMVDNLAALHVERLETEVAIDNTELLRFLCRFGFAPGQRLVFHKPITAAKR